MSLIPCLIKYKPKTLNQLKQTHSLLITTGLTIEKPSTLVKLIEHCFALKPRQNPSYAHRIFHHETTHRTFLFNTLIKCSVPRDSISLFSNWVSSSSIVYDDHTFIFALGACARSSSLSALFEGMQIHCSALKLGFMSDILVSTTVINFYGSKQRMRYARKVFDERPVRSVCPCNALISGYISQRRDFYEYIVEALRCFKAMVSDDDMGVKPNGRSVVCVLSAASQIGSLEIGTCIHGYVVKCCESPEEDVFVGTSLVDMYSRCGCIEVALDLFVMMKDRNVLTWTAMTTGLALHGRGREAVELVKEMKRCSVMPNVVTFTSVLSACCHAGLVEEGLHLFHSMGSEFGITPMIEHYGCVVDLLGKAGHLNEAYEFITRMPGKPDPVLWRSLLGSCRVHGDIVVGDRAGRMLLQLQHGMYGDYSGAPSEDYIGLSNVYALANRWDDVGMVRGEMKVKGLEIKPARSAAI